MITVVSDTSPLVALAFLGLESLIPTVVATEIASPRYGFQGITATAMPGVVIRPLADPRAAQKFLGEVDFGEAEALALALELKAELVVVDDAEARRLALALGFQVTGTIGLLLQAKQRGHISEIKSLLDRLRSELRFFLSDPLYQLVLTAAAESR